MTFHLGQRNAGDDIIDKFTKEQPFSVLLAQMQSGKTGTYLYVAFEMVRLRLVKNVYIICGSSDTSLRSQAMKDLKENFKSFRKEIRDSGDTEGAEALADAMLEGNINVYFSQDLGKLEDISDESLIWHRARITFLTNAFTRRTIWIKH